ncbi:hypothetical protein E2C01_076913 [Portunus trituberculatus]|uniref:Uncharacterized protein n=1 Tax=Portunus trituberculatus TaxID=210409 RepID=A0A5B7IJT8_PORTR|nr:hypothetical protein [Portunus trituberculatus]
MEHEDVFSRDAQDLGCMTLVEHSINTTDSLPIKHKPPHLANLSLAKLTFGGRVATEHRVHV